jgi:hypothetical protein
VKSNIVCLATAFLPSLGDSKKTIDLTIYLSFLTMILEVPHYPRPVMTVDSPLKLENNDLREWDETHSKSDEQYETYSN